MNQSSSEHTSSTLPKTESDAYRLEQEHVHKVYNEIAHKFSDSRYKPWPHVAEFLQTFPSASYVLDIGCGNGKYLNVRKDLLMIGCDRSEGLLEICRERHHQVFLSDCMAISVPENTFDGVISIAVIHHMSTENRRLKALKEIVRIMKVNGQALVTVWAKEQEINEKKSTYIRKSVKSMASSENESSIAINDELTVHTPRTEFQRSDCLVPWVKPTATYLRYYHVFVQNELDDLLKQLSNIEISKSYNDDGNWCAIFRKIA
ncbi:unnamed protein product [Adineta ricciae]|uniref:Methyltransferase type 11 domain-containing protein n=1 Tax=Adineta ricciae TaxID=249248 RepID=A0A815TN41_ADIRI|nr:unnamed protein product [Adineta ricciae]